MDNEDGETPFELLVLVESVLAQYSGSARIYVWRKPS